MKFVDWVVSKKLGIIKETDEYIQIVHDDGDFSYFYRTSDTDRNLEKIPASLRFLYRELDGIDLFSSTFKVCSVKKPVIKNGVIIISSLSTLMERMAKIVFPEPSIPFLNETGNWIYAASTKSETIYSFDIEYGDID